MGAASLRSSGLRPPPDHDDLAVRATPLVHSRRSCPSRCRAGGMQGHLGACRRNSGNKPPRGHRAEERQRGQGGCCCQVGAPVIPCAQAASLCLRTFSPENTMRGHDRAAETMLCRADGRALEEALRARRIPAGVSRAHTGNRNGRVPRGGPSAEEMEVLGKTHAHDGSAFWRHQRAGNIPPMSGRDELDPVAWVRGLGPVGPIRAPLGGQNIWSMRQMCRCTCRQMDLPACPGAAGSTAHPLPEPRKKTGQRNRGSTTASSPTDHVAATGE